MGLQQDRQDLLKCYFTINIIPALSRFDLLINVDESSFSRTTNLIYSWSKKGQAKELMI